MPKVILSGQVFLSKKMVDEGFSEERSLFVCIDDATKKDGTVWYAAQQHQVLDTRLFTYFEKEEIEEGLKLLDFWLERKQGEL